MLSGPGSSDPRSVARLRLLPLRARLLVGTLGAASLTACQDGCGAGCRAQGGAAGSEASRAIPTLTPYDDFSAGTLDPTRWAPSDSLRGFQDPLAAPYAQELVREVAEGALRLATTLRGETSCNNGTAVAHVRMAAVDPKPILAIEATLRVRSFEAVACEKNPAAAFTRATVGGLFFNAGAAEAGGTDGDVLAVVGVGRRSDSPDPPDVLRALAVVLRCGTPCYAFAEHVPQGREPSEVLTMQDIGPVRLGEAVRLGVGWDAPRDRFVFWRDGKWMHELRYTLPDSAPPTVERRHLDVAQFVPRCTAGAAKASIDVTFDDVAVCSSAGDCRFDGRL